LGGFPGLFLAQSIFQFQDGGLEGSTRTGIPFSEGYGTGVDFFGVIVPYHLGKAAPSLIKNIQCGSYCTKRIVDFFGDGFEAGIKCKVFRTCYPDY
jgi:hypothetical protein